MSDQDRLWLAERLIRDLSQKVAEFYPLEFALSEETMEDLRRWQQTQTNG